MDPSHDAAIDQMPAAPAPTSREAASAEPAAPLALPEATSAEPAAPAPAGRRRRMFAWLIDYLVVMTPGLALVAVAVASLVQSLPGFVGAVAAEAGWSRVVRLFTHRAGAGLSDAAAQEWLLFAAPLLVALLVVPLLQFLYLASMLGWKGRTLGMVAADVRAVRADDLARLRRGRAMRRAAATTVVETGLVGGALALMVVGFVTLGLVVWGAAIAFFWLNVIVAAGPRQRSLVDRFSGVRLVRGRLYAAVGRTAAIAGQRGTQAALAAGRTVADAAAVTGELALQAARRLQDSRVAAQTQAIGAAGAQRAKEIGGRWRERWQERRAVGGATDQAAIAAGPVPAQPGNAETNVDV